MREEEKKTNSVKKPSLQRLFRKRWVFPAIYLTCAAIIVAGALWFQNKHDGKTGKDEYEYSQSGTSQHNEPAVPVNEAVEKFTMPVLDANSVEIKTPFYDDNASKEEQEAALVFYDNTYYPNHGIDIIRKDGKTFDVTASLSGTVTKAEKDPILGNVVEIDHENGVVTVYQSLADMKVKAGDTVEQGQVIGKAGQSQFNQEAGIHAHFEIRKDGKPVNPIDYIDKPLTALTEQKAGNDNATEQNNTTPTDEQSELNDQPSSDEQTPSDEEAPATDQGTTTPSEEKQDDASSSKMPDASIGMARA
ncbi:M23 family metallopeptidase [Saccharococcus caldoxylosilyticus]|nr:M23 family metallopeptidase [Parageobacillus caldoxylosilyticus]MBB3851103.1 stage II sporulation protein Q [Parageobacillus caldoxylosilyticus]QXJ38611.1 Stage II sporulation protein Q [Parageobacillus caldoxylosilyticus]BDG37683.1 stage II sporulation protein Q [Parageobacillus caldoxylosilyticus]BDG41475.1 stage II sporulation protein Q [Parageobacillus caldoxylosilyticus]BDG45249.1 stage II sporulation protein Q [Parageobacillus caldoxylosilyticus]